MNLAAALGAFAVIFPLELPDKSLIASLVLATRYRPLPVWLGVATAFAVHVTLAVAFGSLASLLPEVVVGVVVTLAFAVGAVVLLRGGVEEDADEEAELAAAVAGPSPRKIFGAAFGVVFVAEWGDLTQLMTASLVASSEAPISVGLGALAALWAVAGIGVTAGRFLLQRVPLQLVKRISGVLLLALAVWSAIETIQAL